MNRYFFHVENQTSFTTDEQGKLLRDRAAARREAAHAAGAILIDEMLDGRDAPVIAVHVKGGDDREIMVVRVTAEVHQPPPE